MRRRRQSRAGYTLIEVMIAVGIMTVGAVGIMALQQATTRGNVFARQTTTATQITRTWLERIRRDALMWNQRGLSGALTTDYLRNVPVAATADGAWFTPVPADTTLNTDSYAFDGQGNELDPSTAPAGSMRYCVNVRLDWAIDQEAIRADVRTWWYRQTTSTNAADSDARILADCAVGAEDTVTTEIDRTPTSRLHAVYASTLVRWLGPTR